MKKAQWLWWVNILLAAAFVVQLSTVVLRDVISAKMFFTFHIWCGRALLALAVVHLILNWNWVKNNIFSFFGKHVLDS
jgi:hypothetical protein